MRIRSRSLSGSGSTAQLGWGFSKEHGRRGVAAAEAGTHVSGPTPAVKEVVDRILAEQHPFDARCQCLTSQVVRKLGDASDRPWSEWASVHQSIARARSTLLHRCGDGARLIAVDKHDVAFVEVPERGIRAVERSECRDRLCVPLARAISTARAR